LKKFITQTNLSRYKHEKSIVNKYGANIAATHRNNGLIKSKGKLYER